MTLGISLAILGAAISISLAGIGTIMGTMSVAASGSNLLAKDPKLFGQVLLFSALPSSQGLYGFLIAIIITQNVGILGGDLATINTETGLALVFGALPVGLLGLFSGMLQGKVLQSGLRMIMENPSEAGKSIILGVLIETMAVFGFLLSFLVVNNIDFGV